MGFENHPVTVFWMYKPKEYYGYNIYLSLSFIKVMFANLAISFRGRVLQRMAI